MDKEEFRNYSSRHEEDSNQQPFITIQPHNHHQHFEHHQTHHHFRSNNRSSLHSASANSRTPTSNSNDSNQSFEMVPLTVLTPYKSNHHNQQSLNVPLNPSLPSSPSPTTASSPSTLKRSNSSGGNLDYSQSARPSDFSFLEDCPQEKNNSNSAPIEYGDSYMLMWCPWHSMYNNLFVEFWMIRMESGECNSIGENVNCKLLPIKQASKSSNSDRFPTGNFWSYSVGLERGNQPNQSVSTHFLGNELEDLIICFFGVTRIMKFKLNVTKMKIRDRKSSTTNEYVTGVESVEFVELIDYDYLSRKSPLDAYSSWDSFPDDDEDIESENAEITQDIYQSLFRPTHNGVPNLKTSNIPRLEFVHNDNELNFVKSDNDYNFNIYSMNKRRIEDSGNYSPISQESTPQTPSSYTSGSTTLAIVQKTCINLSKTHSLNVIFFQKQTARKLFNKAKSPTTGRFELRSSNSVKTAFETIGEVIPFDLDTNNGIPSLVQPSQYVKICKLDENVFVILEIDKHLLKKLGDNEVHAENIGPLLNTHHHHVNNLPKYFKLFILDLSNPEDIKIKKLTNVKKQQSKVNQLNLESNSTSNNSYSLGVEEANNFIPTYKHQKSKRRSSKPHFTFQHADDVFNMIVFKQDPFRNPHQYTLAIFYKGFGDRYQFNGELSDQSPFKGKWYELVHFTHVSWSKYKTLFDHANCMNHADPSLTLNLGFTDIYFTFD